MRAIADAGGRYVTSPGPTTRYLVVGGDGPPLGGDGRPTRSFEHAARLQSRGFPIEIIDEAAFVGRLGLDGRSEDLARLYTTAQLSRMLGIPSSEIRAWLRHDLIRPVKVVKRLCLYDFQQVARARRLRQLVKDGISPSHIRKSLEQIADWVPDATSALSQLEVLEGHGVLLFRLEDGRLAEPNGQLHLDFARRTGGVTEASLTAMRPKRLDAQDWFQLGVSAEDAGNLDAAVEAYQKALGFGKPQPEVCFNLGNTFYAMDRNVEAAACFIQATEIDPDYVEAWNNLGNALAEIGKHEQAIPAYKRALSIEPSYADAHYNLGETFAMLNNRNGAERHWLAYLKHDPNSPWANRVRERLAKL